MGLSLRTASALAVVAASFCSVRTAPGQDLSGLEAEVASIFGQTCAQIGCHAGSDPQMGMSLEPERFLGHTVGQPSRERPDLQLVHPGKPDSSYLLKKLRGDADIVGVQMPLTGAKLSEQEINTISSWITGLGETPSRTLDSAPKIISPFAGWKAVNLPTTRMVDRGTWLFLISHRFNPTLSDGYDTFFGLDGSSIIFLSLGYAPSNNLLFLLGRSNANDDVELQVKYRFFEQTFENEWPIGMALQGVANWITEEGVGEDRFRTEAFKFSGQLILTREVMPRVGLLLVPGILVNPSEVATDEGPLMTLGLGARWRLDRRLSLIGEWVPIVAGYTRTTTFGNDNRFDSWGGGLEINIGGHVFQIVLTNSVGLATDQYMRGGDLDIRDIAGPDVRLGFNIFRLLQFK